jgi:nucleotide-binding universal stress UspA family protein
MLLERIIVPLDGSATAEEILPDLLRLVGGSTSELIVVHVAASLDAKGFSPAAQEAKAYLRPILGQLTEAGLRARGVLMTGPPAAAILRRTRKDRANLLAVTTHGGTARPRTAFGGVAEQLLHLSPVPVLIRRPHPIHRSAPASRPIRNVLVPLDGSDRALQALPAAIELCRRFAARLFLLQIPLPQQDGAGARAFAETYLRDIEIRAQDEGVAATTTLVGEGTVVDEILDVARFHLVDAIVLSSHGRRGEDRPIVGHVTEAILRRALVPVLVVPGTAVLPNDTSFILRRPNLADESRPDLARSAPAGMSMDVPD